MSDRRVDLPGVLGGDDRLEEAIDCEACAQGACPAHDPVRESVCEGGGLGQWVSPDEAQSRVWPGWVSPSVALRDLTVINPNEVRFEPSWGLTVNPDQDVDGPAVDVPTLGEQDLTAVNGQGTRLAGVCGGVLNLQGEYYACDWLWPHEGFAHINRQIGAVWR